jgi:NAD-dependent dihydropyrimidine dehydrogenase PreA subunit
MAEITIDLDKCEGAGQCVSCCPSNLYKLEKMEEYDNELKSQAVIPDDCILCMACVNNCPTEAITLVEE